MGYSSLRELEDAQQQAEQSARQWIENAEEHLATYQSEINRVQERFYEHASYRGISDDPGFRAGLQRVTEESEESIRTASHAIQELEEDLTALTARHLEERDEYLAQNRPG